MFDCTDEGSGSFFAHNKYSYMEKGIVPADPCSVAIRI